VIGVDNLSSYYSVKLKKDRLKQLRGRAFAFEKLDIANAAALHKVYKKAKPDLVLHLAAQAGVRYSLENPAVYVRSNVVGFANLLECCREAPPRHLVYASSSSIYGNERQAAVGRTQNVDRPVSLYAATKKSNELMAHVYSHLYGIPATGAALLHGLRPVGPPGHVAHALRARRSSTASRSRSSTAAGCSAISPMWTTSSRARAGAGRRDRGKGRAGALRGVQHSANHEPVALLDYIGVLERVLGKKAKLELKPMQPAMCRPPTPTRLPCSKRGLRALDGRSRPGSAGSPPGSRAITRRNEAVRPARLARP